jgi:hypothetical protein
LELTQKQAMILLIDETGDCKKGDSTDYVMRLVMESWIAFNHLKQWLTVFFIPTLEQGFAQLIERMQQFYCPVIHDLLLRRILFNSA